MQFALGPRERKRRSVADVLLFAEAWLSLGLAAAQLKLRPFEQVMRFQAPRNAGRAGDSDLARLVWAIAAARRRAWLRGKCIESALALRSMLLRRNVASTLHYGIRNARGEELQAHVWLSVDGEIVIGGETAAMFTEVASFGAPVSA
jgi:hypothetical protein